MSTLAIYSLPCWEILLHDRAYMKDIEWPSSYKQCLKVSASACV